MLRGAAWCNVALYGAVVLRGAAWCCVVLRGVAWVLRGCCVDAALLLRVVLRVVSLALK